MFLILLAAKPLLAQTYYKGILGVVEKNLSNIQA